MRIKATLSVPLGISAEPTKCEQIARNDSLCFEDRARYHGGNTALARIPPTLPKTNGYWSFSKLWSLLNS